MDAKTNSLVLVLILTLCSSLAAQITSYRFAGAVAHDFYDSRFEFYVPGWDPALGDPIEGTFSFDPSLELELDNVHAGRGHASFGKPSAIEATVGGRTFVASQMELSVVDGVESDSLDLFALNSVEIEDREASFSFGVSLHDMDATMTDGVVLPGSLDAADELTGWMTIALTGPGFYFDIHELEEIAPRVVGDFDSDGKVDGADIDLLAAEIHSAEIRRSEGLWARPSPQFDLNFDLDADSDDFQTLIRQVLETDFGDANLDGLVNQIDLSTIQENLFSSGGWANGDFDGNAFVDASDFNIWNLASTKGLGAAVPEPYGMPFSWTIMSLSLLLLRRTHVT